MPKSGELTADRQPWEREEETKKAPPPYELETGREMECMGAAGAKVQADLRSSWIQDPGWPLRAVSVKEKSQLLRSSYWSDSSGIAAIRRKALSCKGKRGEVNLRIPAAVR